MPRRFAVRVWPSALTRLSYTALLVAVLTFPLAASAQKPAEEASDEQKAEEVKQAGETAQEDQQPAEDAEAAEAADAAKEDFETFSDEVVVVGVRESLTKAVEIKKESVSIVDAVVAEDIGKFPDNNVVEPCSEFRAYRSRIAAPARSPPSQSAAFPR